MGDNVVSGWRVLDVTAPDAALLSKAADWAGFAGNFEGYRAELQKLYGAPAAPPPAAPPPAPVEAAAPAPAVGSGRIDVDRVDIYEFPTAAPAPAEASGTQSRV